MWKLKIVLVVCPLLAMTLKQCPYYKRKPIPNEVTNVKEEQRLEAKMQLHLLGAEPDGLLAKTSTDILFTVLLTGTETPPEKLQLQQVEEKGNLIQAYGYLVDTGKEGDLSPKDGIYSRVFSISSDKEGKLYYRAQFRYSAQEYLSGTCSLTVTSFPIGPAPSDPNFIVTDPNTGQKLYSNEIIVSFVKGTPNLRIKEIIAERKAHIAGTIPSLGVFQLRISSNGTSVGVYVAVKAFQGYKEVEYAEPNYVVELDD